MLLTISTTHQPATDLGYLLHKNPSQVQSFEMSFGTVRVFYPEASAERCTAALLLDIDTIGLVRKSQAGEGFALEQYVNDRPYVASSFLSVAITEVFRSAMAGRSKDRPELAQTAIPLEAQIAALPCRNGGESFLRSLFEPLGYQLDVESFALDDQFPEWGPSPYFTVTLRGTIRLSELLTHLYVLIPVLDDTKHYWVGDEEVEKLLRHGEGWLNAHPARDIIASRYLKHRRSLAREALDRLTNEEDPELDATEEQHASEEAALEKRISLNEQRMNTVVSALKGTGAKRVIDVGCGEGNLLKMLFQDRHFEQIVGLDVAVRSLEIANQRLGISDLPDNQKERIKLLHGSLTYRDKRMEGFDAATCIEVIEHLDPFRLSAFETNLFGFAKPRTVIVTTPNVEYNSKFETLPTGQMRHKDHRFEWTRQQFEQWANAVAHKFHYSVVFSPVGESDPVLGAPTQMAVFSR